MLILRGLPRLCRGQRRRHRRATVEFGVPLRETGIILLPLEEMRCAQIEVGERAAEKPGAPWTVAALAETIALSPSRFAARFREDTGQSAMSCVSNWRMTVACQRLRETDEHLAEVAIAVGYQDTAAFSRAFKALVGKSPARWRSLNQA